ncbi:MAG: hypothetical protein F4X64_18540 [Chloroflexi bacterium]|nr:hypothetical protein [Chloroflexota bacterium]
MLEIKQIRTEAEFEAALARIDDLINCAPGSTEEAELIRISAMVIEYEDEHYPMNGAPNPHSMLEFMLDQQMVTREQLISLAGDAESLDAMLAGQTAITHGVAQLLHQRFGIPVEVLIRVEAHPSVAASD